jgi:hypothetical protein
MNSKSQILTHYHASSDNSNSNNEKIHFTRTDSMIHIFLNAPKIMDDENFMYYVTPSQNFHLLGLLTNKHLKELVFPTLVHKQP